MWPCRPSRRRLTPAPACRAVGRRWRPRRTRWANSVATREAYGTALAKLGEVDPRVVVLDADVKNSTFSDRFEKVFPDRFYQNFIAEQVMVGSAMGLASRGAIAFPSTFACFLTRAYDFIRMAAISRLNVKLAGSHAGVSIGEDGPSQMALEDLAMMRAQPNFAVLYPCDAVSTERLVEAAADAGGPAYIRTSRPKTPVIYGPDEPFPVGGCKVLRQSAADAATVVGAGVTVFEALKAHDELMKAGMAIRVIDLYSIQPIDASRSGRRRSRPAVVSSPSRITTPEAASATPWRRRRREWRRSAYWRSARSRAAASPRSCWTASGFQRVTSLKPCDSRCSAGLQTRDRWGVGLSAFAQALRRGRLPRDREHGGSFCLSA